MKKIYIAKFHDDIPQNLKEDLNFDGSYFFEDTSENRDKFQDIIPYGFKKDRKPIQIDLIPKNSWGASLSNSLTSDSWNSIRKPFIEQFDNRCQLCGRKGHDLRNMKDVDTHEIWEYSSLNKKEKVQKLVGFYSLCSSCHLMFHLGFAKSQGLEDITYKRLQKLDCLSDKEMNKKINDIFNLWEKRSAYDWIIDISILREYGFNKLKFKAKTDQSKFKI